MSNGPFQTKRGGDIIATFAKDELLEPISKMALTAKTSGFRCESSAAGTMRTDDTQSPEKEVLQKSVVCSPNAFLRWVLPKMRQIRELSISASKFRMGFLGSFFRQPLSTLEREFKKLSVDFIILYQKWSTPDILFSGIEGQEPSTFIVDYFQSRPAIMEHFNEGFRLLDYMNRIFAEQSTASYNRISVSLALLAIVISIVLNKYGISCPPTP